MRRVRTGREIQLLIGFAVVEIGAGLGVGILDFLDGEHAAAAQIAEAAPVVLSGVVHHLLPGEECADQGGVFDGAGLSGAKGRLDGLIEVFKELIVSQRERGFSTISGCGRRRWPGFAAVTVPELMDPPYSSQIAGQVGQVGS